jgi:hypothetical protein
VEMEIEEVLPTGEMQGAGLGGEVGALLEQVSDVVGGKSATVAGIVKGAGHGVLALDLTQGDDLAHVMVRVESSLFELPVVDLGLG